MSTSVSGEVCVSAALLRRFVEAYWLRPENAFWMALRSHALSQVELARSSIDVSCGDGVFTFLHCGGEFDPSFDVFQSVGHLDRVKNEHADMFDAVADAYAPVIAREVDRRVDIGLDVKPSMLAKAGRLGFYDKLIEHDNNKSLPFDDGWFETVYCNSAYWVARIDAFLAELGRVTRPGGRIVLHVKLEAMRNCTLEKYESLLGRRFLDILGRGRFDCWPTLCDRATWERRIAAAGLQIEDVTPFVTATHARIWDVGLRPIAPLLVRMTEALTPATRASIKRDWVDLFCELLEPICDASFALGEGSKAVEPVEIQYVLSPCH